jgi:cell wall-associated NlpC family hydrolase
VTQALEGEPLRVEERRAGWARILTAYDYPGWIAESALGPPRDARWPPAASFSEPLQAARSYLGAPYLWGGMSAAGIDCSGLVHMAYRLCGRVVVRDADEQEKAGRPVAEQDAVAGDLVSYGADTADHIAFWLGDGRILHATGRDGLGVVEEPEPPALRERRRRFVRL